MSLTSKFPMTIRYWCWCNKMQYNATQCNKMYYRTRSQGAPLVPAHHPLRWNTIIVIIISSHKSTSQSFYRINKIIISLHQQLCYIISPIWSGWGSSEQWGGEWGGRGSCFPCTGPTNPSHRGPEKVTHQDENEQTWWSFQRWSFQWILRRNGG